MNLQVKLISDFPSSESVYGIDHETTLHSY